MISKLLLIRKKDIKSDLLDKSGFKGFLKGKPVAVQPQVWGEEDGISHYAFLLEGLKLKDWTALKTWNADPKSVEALILDVPKDGDVTMALASVDLKIIIEE